MFLNCSTCFGRHTAHHQELKNYNCSLWFYIWFGCRPLQWPSQRLATQIVCKTRAFSYSFKLLIMGDVSPETYWAIKKSWFNNFYYTVASCWFFLWYLFYDARIHEYQVYSNLHLIFRTHLIYALYVRFSRGLLDTITTRPFIVN
jgi:hypothetical protein